MVASLIGRASKTCRAGLRVFATVSSRGDEHTSWVWTSTALDQTSASQPLLPMADAATIAELESTVASLQATVTSLVHSLSNVTAAANTSRIDAAEEMRNLKGSIDTFYLLYSGTLVFFMQARVPGDRWRVPRHTSTAARLPSCPGRLGSVCSRRGRSE